METIITITPSHICDPTIAIAACRAGELGILDLGYSHNKTNIQNTLDYLARFASDKGRWGIRWDILGQESRSIKKLGEIIKEQVEVLILAGIDEKDTAKELKNARYFAHEVLLEVNSLSAAQAAQAAGYDGVIIKGHEAGGRVGRESSFILLQRLHHKLEIPYWIQGGIGLNTAGAAQLAGAAGTVLCEQLWLTEESPFSLKDRKNWAQLDGSETTCIGRDDQWFRFYSHSGREKLRELENAPGNKTWSETLKHFLLEPDDDPLIPLGQDIAFAAAFAKKYGTVGRVLAAVRHHRAENLRVAQQNHALAPSSPLAKVHGTTYPIVQGPMTRVSDVAPFCKAIAEAGGLPFLALALMREPEVRRLLTKTKAEMKSMPWGVGILGFVPLELRQEQLKVIKEFKPPFVIIAGGRPNQAAELETLDISTYLHLPSPGLLEIYLKEGARKFIFEGRECGGHVGPRTSFVLWESAIQVLLKANIDNPEKVQILFAGGIHDDLSTAMVATIAAPLTALGMRIGILMGTAYLFTEEAIHYGAIIKEYQRQALACQSTILLQTGIGHAIRCAQTPYANEFKVKKEKLMHAGKNRDEIQLTLETLNIGRLRIASKGVTRKSKRQAADGQDKFIKVVKEKQRRDGMYMMGEVAGLCQKTLSIPELHAEVSERHQKYLTAVNIAPIEKDNQNYEPEDVAIVGMSCLFPEASNLKEYWQNILNRIDAVQEVSEDRWNPADFYDPNRQTRDKSYSKWGGFIKEIQFNPLKFGIPPTSLSSIEPMQLLALETAWQALEDAGYNEYEFPRDRTCVIFGVGGTFDLGMDYVFRTMLMHHMPKVDGLALEVRDKIIQSLYNKLPKWTEDSFPGFLGNVFAGRIANRFNLMGSNFTIDAACASSLAVVEVAMRQLQAHLSDVALVGAVDGNNNAFAYLSFSKIQALSPRGRCRTFDDSADGIVISEGVAAIVLKRLSDAERDGDHIYAIIKGVGSSSDGRNRSLTAPNPDGQVSALRRAYEDAGVSPSTVELIEAHGTGTAVGDKAEIQSLNEVFDSTESVPQYCAIGSVKSMIGHTKVAAGMAGLIKCILSLKHQILPPTIGVEVPNSHVDFSRTPFYINTETRPWFSSSKDHPRRAGVSAFGFGGTNFHAVLEKYEADYRDSCRLDLSPRQAEIFSFTRGSRSDMEQAIKSLLQQLEKTDFIDLDQIAYSLFIDEQKLPHQKEQQPCRLNIVAASTADLKNKLKRALNEISGKGTINNQQGLYYSENNRVKGGVCFLFPGQGCQKVNMLRDLVLSTPASHSLIEQADALLRDYFEKSISRYIYPLPAFSEEECAQQQAELNATRIAQPALGVIDLVAFDILNSYGIQPEFVAGHSYGEYVALCAAGSISREELICLSAIRGKIVDKACKKNPGTMAAVQATGEETTAVIQELGLSVWLANLNAPNQTIIAGSTEAIVQAVQALNAKNLRTQPIPVTAAFHTTLMRTAGEALATELAKINFEKPTLSVFSNTTARPYPESPEAIRALLTRHITEPIQFVEQIRKIYQAGARIFIEAGPGRVLTGLVTSILGDASHAALCLEIPGRSGWLQLAQLLARAQNLGLPVNLNSWFKGRRLESLSTDELFEKAQAYANPSPHIWRVNGGRAQPWHQKISPERINTTIENKSEKSSFQIFNKSNPTIKSQHKQERGSNMKQSKETSKSNIKKAPALLENHNSESIIAQFQTNMSQFFEMQREQQKVMQRFLDLQEQILQALLQNGKVSLPKDSHQPTSLRPHSSEFSMGLPDIPQTPVLPKLSVKPAGIIKSSTPSMPPSKPLDEKEGIPPSREKENVTPVNRMAEDSMGIASTEEFQADLLRTISKRTGYPVEMLDLDAHLEGDLSLDSIKMVEIFSELREHHHLLQVQDQDSILEEVSNLNTLRGIIEWYDRNRSKKVDVASQDFDLSQSQVSFNSSQNDDSLKKKLVASQTEQQSNVQPESHQSDFKEHTENHIHSDPVQRFVLKSVPAQLSQNSEAKAFPRDHLILVIGEAPQLTAALHGALAANNHRVRQIIPGEKTQVLKNNHFEVNISSVESIQQLHTLLKQSGDVVGGIFNLLDLTDGKTKKNHNTIDEVKGLFLLVKVFERDLKESAAAGGGWLINFSSMGGQFGLAGESPFFIGQAGCVGLLKTVAREWPEIKVKCIDVDFGMDPHMLLAQITQELMTIDGAVEVGLNHKGRWKIALQKENSSEKILSPFSLDSNSVILVTGGGYGITAEVAKALAKKYQPQIIIVGRTPFPSEESPQTQNLQDRRVLKEYLIQEMRQKDSSVTPAEIEKQLQKIFKQRQILENLRAMESTKARVEYQALDVRDEKLFGELLDNIYDKWGRIDGVIHGAGIIEDKLIKDKHPESFSRVFTTKVIPAKILAEKLQPNTLKFLIFFSSVAGCFGSVGQSDYSAANEVLNKLAIKLDRQWPARVVSINWGPWDSGMVNEELRKLYSAKGIELIPMEEGIRFFTEELHQSGKGTPVVVITRSIEKIAGISLDNSAL